MLKPPYVPSHRPLLLPEGHAEMRKVLVVDDVIDSGDVVCDYLERAGAGLFDQGTVVSSVAELELLLEEGERFDLTICDLALGAHKPTGLSAIDALARHDDAGGKVIVRSDTGSDDARLLLAWAVFHWYPQTVTLIPKQLAESGSKDERASALISLFERIHTGAKLDRDPSKPLRRNKDQTPFDRLIYHTGDTVRRFKTLTKYSSFQEAAAADGTTYKKYAEWGTQQVLNLDVFLREAEHAAALTGIPVATFETNIEGRTNRPGARLSAFAQSQALFFDDPVVERLIEQEAPGRKRRFRRHK